jgi:hypothetical protein
MATTVESCNQYSFHALVDEWLLASTLLFRVCCVLSWEPWQLAWPLDALHPVVAFDHPMIRFDDSHCQVRCLGLSAILASAMKTGLRLGPRCVVPPGCSG